MTKPKLLFFTGAGISAESGLQTFRDVKDGLWNNYRIEDVCTPEAWIRNPEMVLDFYNQRRRQCHEVEPNHAHKLIAKLEEQYDVTVITQNVDNLHERAGSTHVIHLHGELMRARSTADENLIYDWTRDIESGDLCQKKSQLRPHIVWFGEMLDNNLIDQSIQIATHTAICVVIGTSLNVYPANTLPYYVPESSQMIVIDRMANELEIEGNRDVKYMPMKATEGMKVLFKTLIK